MARVCPTGVVLGPNTPATLVDDAIATAPSYPVSASARPGPIRWAGCIPSYRKVIVREGVDHVTDLAAIGSAEAVRSHLNRYLDAGATDVVLNSIDTESVDEEQLWEDAASI